MPTPLTAHLTSHAYDRFCQRAWPASYETVAAYVLAAPRRDWLHMGATWIPIPDDGVGLICRHGVVVTVVDIDYRRDWQRKVRGERRRRTARRPRRSGAMECRR